MNQLLTKISDVLSCPICYEKYNKKRIPKLSMQCGHSFCEQCIKSLVFCSICRKAVQKPNMNESEFLSNFLVLDLVDTMQSLEHGVKCDECDEDFAVCNCENCGINVCEFCASHHKRSLKTKLHSIISLSQLKKKNDEKEKQFLEVLSVKELKNLLRSKGIDITKALEKHELIELAKLHRIAFL